MELVTGSQGDGEADQPELPYLASITDFVVGSEALAQLKKSLAELISLVDGAYSLLFNSKEAAFPVYLQSTASSPVVLEGIPA